MAFDQTLTIDIPDKLVPVFDGPARVRGSYGGRGSAKTRTFAKMAAVWGLRAAQAGREGIVLCAREFMNSLEDSSFAEVAAAIRSEPWLLANYEIGERFIRTKCRRVEFSFIGLRHNLDSIKSKALIILCWIDEAERVSEIAWVKLIPTVREDGSEIWVTWNRERRGSATDKRFCNAKDSDYRIAEMNWRDNPWFPAVLDAERRRDQRDRPEQYDHIWEGDYATALAGAYFAKELLTVKMQGRICRQAIDPLMSIRSFHDIGGSGANADHYVIWIAQFVDREIRILDFYQSQGQSLGYHVAWMRSRGYERASIQLPHDGVNENNVTAKRYMDHWADAGFDVLAPFPNQGKGASMMRVQSARRLFPRIWFADSESVEEGRAMLGFYRANISEDNRDLGPRHDEYSHAADAFGLMCVAYEEPRKHTETLRMPALGIV